MTMKSFPTRRTLQVLICVAATALLGTGCQLATSTQPIGTRPVSLPEGSLEGIWRSNDGQSFFVRVVDSAAGRFEIANVSTHPEGFRLERHELILRQHEGVTFANIRSRDPNPDENYTFGRLTLQESTLILTLAPSTPIRTLALDGVVGASITTNRESSDISYSVVVTNGFERLSGRLAAPDGWQWLDTANPIVLTRQKTGWN